jgi:hypothetical protein
MEHVLNDEVGIVIAGDRVARSVRVLADGGINPHLRTGGSTKARETPSQSFRPGSIPRCTNASVNR